MLKLARWTTTHRRYVVLGWIVLVAGINVLAQSAGTSYSNNFTLPNSDAQRASNLLEHSFPAQAGDRADRMVRHMAIELDATDAQQDKLRAVVKAAVKDLIPLREKVQSARLKARELLMQPTIDRAEIEKFRTEQVALADTFTKRVSQAIGDAAEILTPDQRRKLNDRLPPMGGPGRPWNR